MEPEMMKLPADVLASLNEGFVVAIMLEANDGDVDAVLEIQRWLTPLSMAEPGVKLFLPYQSPTNPALFFIFELYVDEAGWAAHQETAHFKKAIPQLLPLLKRRERIPFVPFLAH
jgi:quinol monooxygenase YgiN